MLFLSAFLVRSKNHHEGSFVARESSIATYLSSPGFCHNSKSSEVHILHDVPLIRSYKRFAFAHFFLVQSNGNISSIEFRFVLFRNHLNQKAYSHSHIYLTDLSDVTVLMRPPAHKEELVVASDAQGARRWLWSKGKLIGYQNGDAYMQSLHNGTVFLYNCGIIGGVSAVLRSFLEALVNQLISFWSDRPVQNTYYGADMFLVNKLLYGATHTPLTGYPNGPVNLPMWAVVPGCRTHVCRHKFLNQTMGTYWFGHKIPPTWTSVFRKHYCNLHHDL